MGFPHCYRRKEEALTLRPPLQWKVLGYAQDRNQTKARVSMIDETAKWSVGRVATP